MRDALHISDSIAVPVPQAGKMPALPGTTSASRSASQKFLPRRFHNPVYLACECRLDVRRRLGGDQFAPGLVGLLEKFLVVGGLSGEASR